MHSRVFIQPKTKPHLLPAGRPHRMREYHYSLRSCHRRSRHPVFGGIRNRDESLGGKRRRLSFWRVVALTFGGLPFRADRGGLGSTLFGCQRAEEENMPLLLLAK